MLSEVVTVLANGTLVFNNFITDKSPVKSTFTYGGATNAQLNLVLTIMRPLIAQPGLF